MKKRLNKQATSVFLELVKMAEENAPNNDGHPYIKVDNNSDFMPVSVELTVNGNGFKCWSVAHYSVQNGDLMSDPRMEFFVPMLNKDTPPQFKEHNIIVPYVYENHYVGIYQKVAEIKTSGFGRMDNIEISKLCGFAEDWLQNIKNQQNI